MSWKRCLTRCRSLLLFSKELDTYYGFRNSDFFQSLAPFVLETWEEYSISDPKHEQNMKNEIQEEQKKAIVCPLIYCWDIRMKRLFSLTALAPADTDVRYLDEIKDKRFSTFRYWKKISTLFLISKKRSRSSEKIHITFDMISSIMQRVCRDEKGLYILILEEPQLVRKRIYLPNVLR